MVSDMSDVEHPGEPGHPDHQEWLLALGRATYASQALAGIAVDVLRTHCGVDFWKLVPDSLGGLVKRLERHDRAAPDVPDLTAWLVELEQALVLRNDLLHALPVKHGLHRRDAKHKSRIVNFFTVKALDDAAAIFGAARLSGNKILYHDGGTAVAATSGT